MSPQCLLNFTLFSIWVNSNKRHFLISYFNFFVFLPPIFNQNKIITYNGMKIFSHLCLGVLLTKGLTINIFSSSSVFCMFLVLS